ncbi:hypothetical protein N0V93_004702 [Gnomoniopsis smithogilvyi]|uniref:WW domain-containing protein n=1 Tax=Gnomoniopsis smithogilvyi TaxID=1191159 RepID=A0A9W8YTB7_9PEZI|nr:hypothetical protein N0V93_004702 [Gnomoniopsis smithogilvyi]
MPSDNEPTSPAKDVVVAPSNVTEEADVATQSSSPAKDEEEAAPASEEPTKDDEPQTAPSPTDSRSEEGEARSDDSPEASEQKERDGDNHTETDAQPPLPNEPTPGDGDAPPLPSEAPPGQEVDDGWSAQWDATNQTWYFYNRFTGVSQWDNPRQPTADASGAAAAAAAATPQISQPTSVAGGYNPAIHGSWDPNAPYAQAYKNPEDDVLAAADEAEYQADLALYHAEMQGADPTTAAEGFEYAVPAAFNRRTGKTQAGEQNPERYSDANKSYRQMNAYFNVDQAANSHDGRSLKAERRGKQPTRKELSMWKEKRKARKEEKRRAWLRD